MEFANEKKFLFCSTEEFNEVLSLSSHGVCKKKKFIKFTAISKHLYFVIRNDNQKDQILRFRPKRVATNNS
jgi:hypothetical protein